LCPVVLKNKPIDGIERIENADGLPGAVNAAKGSVPQQSEVGLARKYCKTGYNQHKCSKS